MAKKKPANHTHRYERVVMGKNNYVAFKCNLPTCPHYVSEALVAGKLSICNRCGGTFILDNRAMKLVKPHCIDCVEVKIKAEKKEEFNALADFLEEKGI